MDSDEGKKVSTIVAGNATAFLESIAKEVPRLPTMKPKAGDPTKEMEVALPAPVDIKMVEIALVTAPLALPMVAEEV